MSIYDDVETAFLDRFAGIIEDGTVKAGESPAYLHDELHEIADSLVPVYTVDRVQEWLEDGCPDVSDPGLIEGMTRAEDIIGVALYERYLDELYGLAREAGFENA